jgi:Zn-dependent peptidase ImmA (M78 family)/transcriptional regulator with XRE-family HTH domain
MKFNGELLRLARLFRGFTQRELAVVLGTEASTLSRVENGLIEPSSDFIERVIDALKMPSEFFRQTDQLYGLPLSVHPSMWRKKAATSQHDVDRALAELNLRIIHLRRLLPASNYDPVVPLPELDAETYDGDIEKIANMVRRTWMVPAGAISDLTSWVERAGVFVIHAELPDSAMDGVTIRPPDAPPVIFLNKKQPSDRMRFSLAHELGHLVMHRVPNPNMEAEANHFAGAFLVPASDIRSFFLSKKIDLPLLAGLKPEWRVAMAALLYRAKQLGYVNENQARYLWQQFNAHKIRLREPPELDFPAEQPTLMPKLLSMHIDELGYSLADMRHLLAMYEKEIISFHSLDSIQGPPGGRPKLRIVS